MSDMQKFDDNIIENLRMFSFKDDEQIYTNGVELVPLFRVIQILEYFKVQELVDRETPKKPLPPKDTFFLHQCPNCKVDFIGSSIDRCQCGQKIEWKFD